MHSSSGWACTASKTRPAKPTLVLDREVADDQVLFAAQRRPRVHKHVVGVDVELRRLEREPPARGDELLPVELRWHRVAEAEVGIAQERAAVVLLLIHVHLDEIDARAGDTLIRPSI